MAVEEYLSRVEDLLAPDPGGPPTGYISAQDIQSAFSITLLAIDETYVERFTESVQEVVDSLNLEIYGGTPSDSLGLEIYGGTP